MGPKSPETLRACRALTVHELRKLGLSVFNLPSRSEWQNYAIACTITPLSSISLSAIVIKAVRTKGHVMALVQSLEPSPSAEVIEHLRHLQAHVPWVTVEHRSFNETEPGGPYAWYELIRKRELIEKVGFQKKDYKGSRRPIRRTREKLMGALSHAEHDRSLGKGEPAAPELPPPRTKKGLEALKRKIQRVQALKNWR